MLVKPGITKTNPYDVHMARNPRADRGKRPKQGAHLLNLRESAGLTQTQLAGFVGVPQGTIALWEWNETPPRSSALPKLAKALGVSIADLLVVNLINKKPPIAKKPGPVSDVQKAFEDVRSLPRHQQKKILETVSALVEQYKRKVAS